MGVFYSSQRRSPEGGHLTKTSAAIMTPMPAVSDTYVSKEARQALFSSAIEQVSPTPCHLHVPHDLL